MTPSEMRSLHLKGAWKWRQGGYSDPRSARNYERKTDCYHTSRLGAGLGVKLGSSRLGRRKKF